MTFHELFNKLPGSRTQRIEYVSRTLHVSEQTVRIWLVNNTARPCPERQVKLLKKLINTEAKL